MKMALKKYFPQFDPYREPPLSEILTIGDRIMKIPIC